MKKQNENGRISEDRLSRANKRKKNNTIASILVMTGCLLVLVLVTYVAGILYSWIDSRFQDNANDLAAAAEAGSQTESAAEAVKTYTQEEVDALIAEAKQQAEDEEENKILSGIRDGLTSGTTMVETLRPYYPDELVVVSNGTFNFVPIRDDLQKNDYALENLNILEDGEVQYMQDGQVVSHKGIDVSKHQGNIDWTKVAADGVEFAFIRVGLRGYGTEGKLVEDEYFEQNIKGALQAGIKVGVYFYSQAITDAELLEEANLVLEKVKPYNVELPIVYDVEKVSGGKGRANALSVEERTRLTALFCQTVQDAGYKPMIYHNMEMSTLMLDLAVSGFGCYGSYSDRPGYDIISQAMGGLMSVTGAKNGDPTRSGNAMGDILGGMNLVIGVLMALNVRTLTGKGQKVDVSLVDSVVASLENAYTRYFESGQLPVRNGNAYASIAPYDSYQAKDGQVIIACGNQKLYEKLCNEVLHMPWMITDERFLTVSLRVQNNEIQKKYIEEWTTQYTVNEIVENVLAKGIPAGPIYNVRQITEDKHIAIEREMFVEIEHPVIGKMKVNGNPIKLMDNMPEISKPAPTLGQHNEEIFCGLLKHSEEQIKEWRKHNII